MIVKYFFLVPLLITRVYALNFDANNTTTCDHDEDLIGGICYKRCPSTNCGENATCHSRFVAYELIPHKKYCKCLRGYTGDPRSGCLKMDENSPCSPSPCGPNSECIAKHDEIGPHCKCLGNPLDFPPNCRSKCNTNADCGETGICEFEYCEDLCANMKCGSNSICRIEQEFFPNDNSYETAVDEDVPQAAPPTRVYCSCKEGYIPQRGLGCRKMKAEDTEIPVNFIEELISDPCGDKCGVNAYCDLQPRTCICTQGYVGDPFVQCSLNVTDPCNPNLCGPYSRCSIVDGRSKCECIDGFVFKNNECSKCISAFDCGLNNICVGGRCVPNVCFKYCGSDTYCNIFEGKLECGCQKHSMTNPFVKCSTSSIGAFADPSLVATLLG